ncbi:VOC family protein [Paenibacillus mesophilus]|uniref:VOC family protein n=1 Tax=Paenibacillus mesophilus TaxID=2582849 RepID=UPI00110D3BE2|nr:VOC family protein [Paenibacillus mesophilus]TMV48577.1 VOC family protein [Paenibacillus mesophilus]
MSMQQLAEKKGLFVTNGDIVLGNLVPDPHIDSELTNDGLQFSYNDRWGCARTAGMAFSAPMQIKAEIRSSVADFRLHVGPNACIRINGLDGFLISRDPVTKEEKEETALSKQISFKPNEFVHIQWDILPDYSVVKLNDEELIRITGDYSKLTNTVHISSYKDVSITVKSLDIQRLSKGIMGEYRTVQVPDLRSIGSVFIEVKDSTVTSEWYATKLGLTAAYLGNGLGTARPIQHGVGITMLGDPGHNAGVRLGFYTPDIRRTYEIMKENGVEIVGELRDYGDFAEFNFKDVDGNLMMVCWSPEK